VWRRQIEGGAGKIRRVCAGRARRHGSLAAAPSMRGRTGATARDLDGVICGGGASLISYIFCCLFFSAERERPRGAGWDHSIAAAS
jgi:hypothetical protein